MKTVTMTIPDTSEMDNKDVAKLVASQLYGQEKLSLGIAAEVAGLTKRTFAELPGEYIVALFNYPASGMSGDVANA